MLRVRIEIVPHGDESRSQQLAQIDIVNDGTGTNLNGHYDVVSREFSYAPSGAISTFTTEARILDFERDIATPIQLVSVALDLVAPPIKRTLSSFSGKPWGHIVRRQ